MDARVRATQGAVAEEPEVTAGGRIASGTAIEGRGSVAYTDVGNER